MRALLPVKHDFSDIKESPAAFTTLARLFGEDLAVQQLALEHEAYELGEQRFVKNLERAIESGDFADSQPAQPLLVALVPRFINRYNEWLEHQNTKVRRKHVAIEEFRKLKPEIAAVATIKRILSLLAVSGMGASVQRVAIGLGQTIEDEMRFGRIREEEVEHYKRFVKPALDKRNGQLYKKEYLKAVEQKMLAAGDLSTEWVSWDRDEANPENDRRFQVGIKLMEILIESTELIIVRRDHAGNAKKDQEIVELHPEWVQKMGERAFSLAGIAPVYQPCVVPPKKWTGVKGGGYWARGRKPLNFVRVRNKKALERYRDVFMPEVYEAVNLAQGTAWAINSKVLDVVNQLAEWRNVPIAEFPPLDGEELPQRHDGMDEDETVLKHWKREASKVYRRERARTSRRLRFEFIVEQANKFKDYEAIWFPYNMDWRGRVYAIPAFNPQGNDVTKGLLQAAQGEPIGPDGRKWLAIHGANTAGVDKVSFNDRLKWVEDNKEMILEVAKDPLGCTWWMDKDSPFCFLAFCFEWAGVEKHGDLHVSALPIAFDGSCSGIQHFSAMLRDERGGKAVNLVPSEQVQDIYRLVADEVNKRILADIANGTGNEAGTKTDEKTGEIRQVLTLGTKTMAKGWMEYEVTRKVTKRSVMTLPYGSKEYGFSDQLLEDIIRPAVDSGEGTMFTDPGQYARYLAKHIWDSVSTVVVAAVEAMNWLQSAAKLMATEVKEKKSKKNPEPAVLKPCLPISWTTPDGFPVWQEYYQPIKRRIDLMFLGTHRMEATVVVKDSAKLDAKKQEAGVSPNFVHSQDGSHLRKTVVKANRAYGIEFFALIHDSFGTIPAHAGKMFRAVRETMVETYENNDVLAEFREEFMDQLHETQLEKMPALPKAGTLDIRLILQSDFAFA